MSFRIEAKICQAHNSAHYHALLQGLNISEHYSVDGICMEILGIYEGRGKEF